MDGPTYFLGPASIKTCSGNTVSNSYTGTTSMASITDGTNSTAIFSEMVKGDGALSRDGLHMIYKNTVSNQCQFYGQPNADLQMSQACQASTTINYVYIGKDWPRSYSGNTLGASAYHPGGVNVGFLDGSVHFVKNSVAYNVWLTISTRNGNEVVSADAL